MICQRLYGGSIRDCGCRLNSEPWWAPCPSEARRVMPKLETHAPKLAGQFSGDSCQDCGSFEMVRTGTCLTCQQCGSSSGGCS